MDRFEYFGAPAPPTRTPRGQPDQPPAITPDFDMESIESNAGPAGPPSIISVPAVSDRSRRPDQLSTHSNHSRMSTDHPEAHWSNSSSIGHQSVAPELIFDMPLSRQDVALWITTTFKDSGLPLSYSSLNMWLQSLFLEPLVDLLVMPPAGYLAKLLGLVVLRAEQTAISEFLVILSYIIAKRNSKDQKGQIEEFFEHRMHHLPDMRTLVANALSAAPTATLQPCSVASLS